MKNNIKYINFAKRVIKAKLVLINPTLILPWVRKHVNDWAKPTVSSNCPCFRSLDPCCELECRVVPGGAVVDRHRKDGAVRSFKR